MAALSEFGRIWQQHHSYAQEWKARHQRKVLGYFCIYVPEDLVYAAGVLPVRVTGSREPEDVSEPYITGWWCPHCRSSLAEALKGRYDYIDGIAIANTCPHIYQTFNSWQRHLSPSFSHDFWMPTNLRNPFAADFVRKEFSTFKKALEAWLGRGISDADLRHSLEVYNHNRQLLHRLYELKKAPRPPITGAQTLEVTLAGMVMDKREHSQLLEQALRELEGQEGPEPGIRLLLLGSEFDDVELVRFLETQGAMFVADELCTGSRQFWGPPTSLEGDPLAALAQRYVDRPVNCPHKDIVERRRLPHIMKLVEEYRVQGVVYLLEKFCEPHGYDLPRLNSMLKAVEIPFLLLEVDLTTPAGQFRTRVEAFLDLIRQPV